MKSIKSKILVAAAIASVGTSFAIASPGLTKADSINPNSFEKQQLSVTPNYVSPEREDVQGFEDYLTANDTLLTTLQDFTNWNVKKFMGAQFIYSKLPSYSVEVVPNTKKDEELSSPEFVGTSELSHTGGTSEQTLYSSGFSKAIAASVTSTTTHGAKVGGKAGGKLKLPLVAEGSVELSAEYNFAHADTKTESDLVTYTVPSQPVKLKPNERAVVTATLKMMESTGDVKLRTAYSGEITAYYKNLSDINKDHSELMGNWVKTLLNQKENQALNGILDYSRTDPNVAYLDGKGTYKAKYGSKMIIKVEIFQKNTRTADSTPIRSYSYETTPEIKQ
ncbi:ETX/MTX2 family pore-forming toxin [Bacillus thuringiensis]|uniref:ETX/MTX2 family pore-forming toxin n=1 Tax=Bacillus thuringiensis TaxID=1428 RepID=UPI002224E937|nr:ETX/MTX2 family pore-forming toxin [Bacillus thuringiensis]UYX52468.1 ETX/MTX2 family pore-forming toxin [Bacillus thuringiensis]